MNPDLILLHIILWNSLLLWSCLADNILLELNFVCPYFSSLKIKIETANQKITEAQNHLLRPVVKSWNILFCQCDFIAGWKMSKVRMTNQSSEEKWLLDKRCRLSWLPFHCTFSSPLFQMNVILPFVLNYLFCTEVWSWNLYSHSQKFCEIISFKWRVYTCVF